MNGFSSGTGQKGFFPLPAFCGSSSFQSSSSSRRVQQRLRLQRRSVKLANMCVTSLNLLNISLSTSTRNLSSNINQSVSSSSLFSPNQLPSSQLLAMQHVKSCATRFVKCRPDIECDASDSSPDPVSSPGYLTVPARDRLKIIASKVSLPSQPGVVDMLKVLPSSLAARYASPQEMLRPDVDLIKDQLPRPILQASQEEYVALIRRMMTLGMVSFTHSPEVVNGVFGVVKDVDKIRLIIDARPANKVFVDPDPVELPSPSVVAQLSVPVDATLYTGKSDLDNFYHRLRLPDWMQPYFALPPVRCSDVGLPGGDVLVYPCCTTLPMGWSHSVFVAQSIHEHVVDSRSGLSKADRMTSSSTVYSLSGSRVLYVIYIDDVLFFSLDPLAGVGAMAKYDSAVSSVGLPVKPSKRVAPTSDCVEGLGLEIDGRARRIGVSPSKLWKLCDATVSLFGQRFVSGDQLRVLMGRWTWACLINRPSLSVFNAVYRFIEVAGSRNFTLWPVVRRELELVMGLVPLLFVDVSAQFSERVVATDASGTAQGVVACRVPVDIVHSVASECGGIIMPDPGSCDDHPTCPRSLVRFVQNCDWRVIVSSRWRAPEHINSLELRAVSTAVRWLLSTHNPLVFGSKLLILCDSQVVVGALRKGRSPSRVLLRRLRAVAALALVAKLRLTLLWIPTDINPADEPSRR
jgi:hypothetical protein